MSQPQASGMNPHDHHSRYDSEKNAHMHILGTPRGPMTSPANTSPPPKRELSKPPVHEPQPESEKKDFGQPGPPPTSGSQRAIRDSGIGNEDHKNPGPLSHPAPPTSSSQDLPPPPDSRRPPLHPVLLPEYRHCYKDGLVKPMRAHHCRICGTVRAFDHLLILNV